MKQYYELILHPFLLALLATFLVLLIFPLNFPKYTTKNISAEKLINDAFYQYDDLDGDGNSEKISGFHNSFGIAAVTINRNGAAITQINLHGTFNFGRKSGRIITGDRDSDGWKEIYIFTLAHDTVLLHCIENNYSLNPAIVNKSVARCGISNGKLDPYIIEGTMDDLNEDGTKELIFGIATGFSLHPRQIFAYDVANDSIWASPYSEYFLSELIQADITGDGKSEIIPYGYAASNVHDTTVKYHDRSSWLMVLDRKLQFLFEPVEFESGFSNVSPFVFRRNGKPVFMATVCPPQHKGDSAYLITFTKEGQISGRANLK